MVRGVNRTDNGEKSAVKTNAVWSVDFSDRPTEFNVD